MFYVNNVYLHIFRSLSHVFFILKMSTIHTEASVAASEVEPSASNVYDYSESINDNDEKLDEGLRAPIPMHDDAYDLDTSLLSDNELEAFVKTKHYGGKSSSIPSNLVNIFQRCTGYNKWTSSLYKQSQHKHVSSSNKNKTLAVNPNQSTPQSHHYKTSLFSTLPQIQSSDNNDQLQQEESYVDESTIIQTQNSLNQSPTLNQPEQSPFASITPAASQANMLESIDSDADEHTLYKIRKQTLPFPMSPTIKKEDREKKEKNDENKKIEIVPDCTLKELQKMIGQLSSEVINLQQNLYIRDIQIKNMYLRLREFSHISFPQLMIERIHIVANYNNKHKYKRNNRTNHSHNHHYHKRMTLSEEDSVSHGGTNAMRYATQNNSYTLSIKHHSTVTLEVITRWLPRYNLPIAIKKGLIFVKEDDISDIDDYLIHQMYSDWNDIGNKKYDNKDKISTLDKIKKDDVHKQLINYMQHERVGLVRIEILRGKKYKKYKRIEKKFESLIIPISDIPKGDTYHIMIKVHNPSASIWGPLSNMISIKVPLKFIDDDDTDNDNNDNNKKHNDIKGSKRINKTKR
eukprot:224004_1